ncbi:hypothetical protein V2J09_015054 [Rumex salicifolius]
MTPQIRAMHTIQSHGVEIARFHVYDWLVLIVLVALEAVLELVINPFNQFVSKDMMADLKFPLKANTVPMWTVPLYAGALPIVIFVVFYFRRRNVYDLHNAVLGLMYAILMTAVMTSGIKNAVGRPRPDFFWRCFPDGNEMYDSVGNVICNGQESVVTEGYKSFPSGHSSMSFAGLGFVSLYLAAKMKAFDEKGHVAKLCVVITPLLAATMVAISRVDDYWHHWQDVFVGGFLGTLHSYGFCYRIVSHIGS